MPIDFRIREALVARAKEWLSHHADLLLLTAILILALGMRLYDVNWDEGHHAHPDERWISIVATEMRWPSDLTTALSPHETTWNPLYNARESAARGQYVMRHFAYGHLPLYLLTVIAWALHQLAPIAAKLGASAETIRWLAQANTYDGFPLVGRHLSALFDTGSVALIYAIGRRVYGRKTALLAAALSALTVTQIQLAHFYAFDPVATFFVMLAVWASIRLAQDGDVPSAVLAGIAAGCAVSSKFSAMPILAAPGVAVLVPLWRAGRAHGWGSTETADALRRSLGREVLVLICAFLAFFVTSPFAVLDWEAFRISVIEEQGAMVRGEADFPYTRQYRGTPPYIYHIEQQVRWGMGWPLGLTAFAGFAWVLMRAARRRATPGEWVILGWVVPYFGLTGAFMVKFMRYLLPVVPLFTLMGAAMLWALHDRVDRALKARPGRSPLRYAVPGLIAIILLGTAMWAFAFVNGVYGGEHPWIQASRWFYQNAPDGSVILWELWDDPLPLSLDEPGMTMQAHGFRHIDWGPFEEDTQQKFEILKARLREADFIAIASNRIYRVVPRLAPRYPMTTRYYELLFAGELGFEKAAEFTSYPRLDGLVFVDDDADESFTLYDHPKPIIFRKVRDLTDKEWDALLGGTWESAIPYYTGSRRDRGPAEARQRKSLLLDQPVDTLPVVEDFRWNAVASRHHAVAVILWWAAMAAVGALAWPITFIAFPHLRDRGHGFARLIGWLLIGWIVWILASLRLLRQSLPAIGLAALLVLAVSVALWRRRRGEIAAFWQANRGLVWAEEGLWASAYLAFVLIRLLNPDLWQPWNGGEKFMEFAFLNAIVRSPHFPPYDPYFAGGYINYYYYGLYLVGLMVRITGIASSVAFNLAVPTLFAATITGAFSLAYSLAPRPQGTRFWSAGWKWGLMGAILVAGIGNLDGMGQNLRHLAQVSSSTFTSRWPGLQTFVRAIAGLRAVLLEGRALPGYSYWEPSRVIPYTINEFPLWSFLFADLHPHMIGIPFTIAFLAMAYNLVAGYGTSARARGWIEAAIGFGLLPLTLGGLGVINTWDLPTYFGVGVLAFLLREWRRATLNGTGYGWRRGVAKSAVYMAYLAGFTFLLYAPFYRHYQPVGSTGVGIVRHPTTQVSQWLMIWGFLLSIVVVFVFSEIRQRVPADGGRAPGAVRLISLALRRWDRPGRLWELTSALLKRITPGFVLTTWGVLVLALAGLIPLALGYRVVALLWLPLLAAFLLLWRNTSPPEDVFTAALIFTGLLVLAGVEVFFLKDFLCGCPPGSNTVGEYYRMNTLFKFYIQAWVLLGLGGGAALARLIPRARHQWHEAWRDLAAAVFVILFASSLAFPIQGIPERVNDRFPGPRPPRNTLDGMAYMTVGQYYWPDEQHLIRLSYDYEAIRWLWEHVHGSPVVAEAPAAWYPVGGRMVGYDYYRAGGLRVASMTGFPTLLGQHQGEQRYGEQVAQREREGVELFQTTDIERTQMLLRQLRVSYIYLGQLERILFPPEVLAKFDRMAQDGRLDVLYQNPAVTIYRVR
ncbi:MAG: hypothetical protein Kow0047_28150 [Anaerolineae bacterium]